MTKQAFNLKRLTKEAQQKLHLELKDFNGKFGPYSKYIIIGNTYN